MDGEIIFGDNIMLNGNASNGLTGWQTQKVTVSNGFNIAIGGGMTQVVKYTAAAVEATQFKMGFVYEFEPKETVPLSSNTTVFLKLEIKYSNGTVDTYNSPLKYARGVQSTTMFCDVAEGAIISQVSVKVVSNVWPDAMPVRLTDISLQSGVDGLASHEMDDHPHELPFSISINGEGIKATKGDEVMFWLKNDGDAIYNGELSAAQITTGQLSADRINTSELVVGENIQMGPGATISWGNVIGSPDYIKQTYIDETNVMSPNITGGNIYGAVITGGQIRSNSTIDVTTDARIGENIYLNTTNFNQGVHFRNGFTGGYSSITLADPGGGIHCNTIFIASTISSQDYRGGRAELREVRANHLRATEAYDGKVKVGTVTLDIRGGLIYGVS